MQLDRILAENDVFLAPMAGVTDRSFRILCKELGCGLTYTEMVSAKGLHYGAGKQKAKALLSIDPNEAPAAVQLFGSDPEILTEQALALCESLGDSLALIDLNMGCPAHKIVGNGEGSALMKDPDKAFSILSAVSRALPKPLTVKFRKGWDDNSVNAVAFAQMAQAAGAAAVTVHGRTREQQYAGKADWGIIRQVKAAVSIPVIGNGDIAGPGDALAMLRETGCDGVMIARGALGDPWLFERVNAAIEGLPEPPAPNLQARMNALRRQVEEMVELKGEAVAMPQARAQAIHYMKGLKGAAALRRAACGLTYLTDLEDLIQLVFDLQRRPAGE